MTTIKILSPRLYLNNGKGIYVTNSKLLPSFFLNASCIKPADVDEMETLTCLSAEESCLDAMG